MSQIHNISIKFMDFPAELLLQILGHLDVYDLVKHANDIRHLVDSSSELQFLIDVRYFNAIPTSLPSCDIDISTRRQLLQNAKLHGKKPNTLREIPSQCLTFQTTTVGRAVFLESLRNPSDR
ncbi:hypothetical protein BDR07DRAFT_1501713 [Suillus spraguei]|nr:hypothetical protein BDR07DRAFT_1501713 [Suillus spraguei]